MPLDNALARMPFRSFEGATMHSDEQERRERRLERAERFAREVSSWSSQKLRMTYAQPEAVRAAEEREQREALARCKQEKSE